MNESADMPVSNIVETASPVAVEFAYPTRVDIEETALRDFEEFLNRNYLNLNEDTRVGLVTGFHEIFVNALYHGNFGVHRTETMSLQQAAEKAENFRPEKQVVVRIFAGKDDLEIKIMDEGKGFDLKDVPDPTSALGLEQTSGRGILLAKHYFDKVDYERTPFGMNAILRKKFAN